MILKKYLSVAIAAVSLLTTGITASAKSVSDYTDVQPEHWYYDYVADISERELMTGLDWDYFGASELLARAQVATILYRLHGNPFIEEYTDTFPDVPDGQFFTSAVLWASQNGIITGYTDTGKFEPSKNITREELAVMMWRNEGQPSADSGTLSGFSDQASVSSYAYEAMCWATDTGIIQGMGTDGSLNPQGQITRAECATILSRVLSAHQHIWKDLGIIPMDWSNTSQEDTGATSALEAVTNIYACISCGLVFGNDESLFEDRYFEHVFLSSNSCSGAYTVIPLYAHYHLLECYGCGIYKRGELAYYDYKYLSWSDAIKLTDEQMLEELQLPLP